MDSYRGKKVDRTLPSPKDGAFASFWMYEIIPKRSEVQYVISQWTITSQQEHLYNLPGKYILK